MNAQGAPLQLTSRDYILPYFPTDVLTMTSYTRHSTRTSIVVRGGIGEQEPTMAPTHNVLILLTTVGRLSRTVAPNRMFSTPTVEGSIRAVTETFPTEGKATGG